MSGNTATRPPSDSTRASRSDGLDRYYLPRFALNETYGDLDRFRLVVNALPLSVDGMTPGDPLLDDANNPPAFGFTVREQVRGLSRIACYHSQSGQASVERLGQGRIEVRFPAAFGVGRSRVNCTMPGPAGPLALARHAVLRKADRINRAGLEQIPGEPKRFATTSLRNNKEIDHFT